MFFSIIGLAFGGYRSSENILLKDLEIAIKKNKPEKIYKKVRTDGNKVTKAEIKPIVEYYSEKQEKVTEIMKELKSSGESGFFKLINNKFLFFDNYYLEIDKVEVEINSNFDNTKIFINEIEKYHDKISVIPGKYLIRGELETLYGVIEKEEEVYLVDDVEYTLNMPAINISLSSNFQDANVFINDKSINKKVNEVQNFGPIPLEKDITIQLEKEFPWGLIKSEKVKVQNLPNINIDIKMVNDNLISDINKATEEFYDSVFNALNKSDYNLIENSRENTKSKIYDSIKRESLFLKNNYEIKDLQVEMKSSEFYYEDEKYKGNIVINLNYNISKKLLPFIDKKVEEMFLTNVEYENNEWIITDVQKFNLQQ